MSPPALGQITLRRSVSSKSTVSIVCAGVVFTASDEFELDAPRYPAELHAENPSPNRATIMVVNTSTDLSICKLLIKLQTLLGLLFPDQAHDDFSFEIIFATNRRAGHASQKRNLSDVCEGVRDRALKDFLGRVAERRV